MKFIDKLKVLFSVIILLIVLFKMPPSLVKAGIIVLILIIILSILLGRDKVERKSSYKFDEIAKLFGGECVECGSTEDLEKHHKRPLYKGGTNDLDNIVILCNSCHKREHRRR